MNELTSAAEQPQPSPNTGHGHVRPRPDGVRARCGGPALCAVCQREQAALAAEQPAPVAVVTECEACFTPDVCQLRGTCDHYSAEWLRVAPPAAAPVTDAMVDAAWKAMKIEPAVPMTTAVRERLRASIKAGIEAAMREQGR